MDYRRARDGKGRDVRIATDLPERHQIEHEDENEEEDENEKEKEDEEEEEAGWSNTGRRLLVFPAAKGLVPGHDFS